MNRKQIIGKILLALDAGDGIPLPESALIRSVQVLARPDEPTISDVSEALMKAQHLGYVIGADDELAEPHFALTTQGKLKARTL